MEEQIDKKEAFARAEERLYTRYHLDVKARYIDLTRPRLRARVLEVGKGQPVFFVPAGAAFPYAPLFEQMNGIQAITVDLPGFGLSDEYDYRGIDLRHTMVEFLEGIYDALGLDRVTVVGNSFGGLYSLWHALDRPSRIEAVVLAGSPAFFLDAPVSLFYRLMSYRSIYRAFKALMSPSMTNAVRGLRMMGHDPTNVPLELIECVYRAQMLDNVNSGMLTVVEGRVGLRGARIRFTEEEARKISQPVHFIWGENDPFGTPDLGRRGCELIPNATIEVVTGGFHPWLDNAPRCAASMGSFIRSRHTAAAA